MKQHNDETKTSALLAAEPTDETQGLLDKLRRDVWGKDDLLMGPGCRAEGALLTLGKVLDDREAAILLQELIANNRSEEVVKIERALDVVKRVLRWKINEYAFEMGILKAAHDSRVHRKFELANDLTRFYHLKIGHDFNFLLLRD